MKKLIPGIHEKHILECNKGLRPSATVKNLERGCENPEIIEKINKRQSVTTKRSNSTQRIGDFRSNCGKCKARIPLKAKFCMMCGTLKGL